MARGMVLAAGWGKRLRPLTLELPKPLVPLGDTTPLALAVRRLRPHVEGRVAVNVHHLSGAFEPLPSELADAVQLVVETSIRGTAGGVAGAVGGARTPALVWNGDIVAEPDLPAMLARVESGGICMAVGPPRGAGTVGLDAQGKLVRVRGLRWGMETTAGDFVGIWALGCDALARLPKVGCLINDLCLPWVRAGGSIQTCWLEDPRWTDLGTPRAYFQANLEWLARRGARLWCHPEASIGAGIEPVDCLVGQGARLEGVGRVERCVVWPGALVRAPLVDAVVTPRVTLALALPPRG